jgi:D-alanyl-lipoteichoic acid acyltransferase DltB (MBOAT superfamily)
MSFTSIDFLIFFIICWLIQRILPHRPRNLFLLATSYFFYGCWDWRFLSLIFLSTALDYVCSHRIARSSDPSIRNWYLTLSCVANLGLLGFFKYFNFFIDSATTLLHSAGYSGPDLHLNIVLPVGISFYTFQTMSYTIDVYRRDLTPLDNFIDFALYVAFFPQLVAGPIERGASLAPQMLRKKVASWEEIQTGTWLCTKGIFKKAVIADNMASIVNDVFGGSVSPSGTAVLLGLYAFAFQIYGDFAGYSDIARGTARMMGYELMLNFRLPYFATTPSEFWQRWHISLSSWLRDYLYIPLGGNRGGLGMTYRNLLLTMLLGGLWHGAAWTFVLWGAFHGTLLVIQRLVLPGVDSRLTTSAAGRWLQRLVMFHLICIGWLFFRAESVNQVLYFFQQLMTHWTWNQELAQIGWQIVLLCGPLMAVQAVEESTGDLNIIPHLTLIPRTLAYLVVLIMIMTLGSFGSHEFIYFQF